MTKSSSRQEDEARESEKPGRFQKAHGGELVESISEDELELMNEPECIHETLIRDESETDFNGFICANPKCGIVVLFDKN